MRAIAEYGLGSGMMVLNDEGFSVDKVDELWSSKKTKVDVEKFADFLGGSDYEHKFIIECSGTMEQVQDADFSQPWPPQL